MNEKGVLPLSSPLTVGDFTIVSKTLRAICHDVNGQMTCRLSWIPSCKTPSYKPRIREDDSRLRLAPASL